MKKVYLDYSATSPVREEVLYAMQPYFNEKYGNPSSLHAFGQEAKAALNEARQHIASLIGAKQDEIIFTSGGSEANNTALFGILRACNKKHLIVSQIEHPSILGACKYLEKTGYRVTYLPVDQNGLVDLKALRESICQDTALVSIMHANNEIGTIEPIEEASSVIKESEKSLGCRIYFHTDAVQTAGLIPVDVERMGIDLLSLSAHKIYGPKGVGALFVRSKTLLVPLIFGGEQEYRRRGSTENLPGIVGFGRACELAKAEMNFLPNRIKELRDRLQSKLLNAIDEIMINGHLERRLPNNLNVSIKYIEGESMLIHLDLSGIAASTGSACSSGSLEPSHVMLAIGRPHELAHGSIRFTLGKESTIEDVDYVAQIFPKIVHSLRKISPLCNYG